jgi:16S rRNA (guanine966-N2)-methyltransferase
MRIIAGKLGGRQFNSPHSNSTHPMGDKIRGALFNILGDISGLTVLDAFAGTGAVGFEALSRDAAHVVAIDSDRSAQKTIAENCKTLGLESQIQVVGTTASNWLKITDPSHTFDLVILDPPYGLLQRETLKQLAQRVNDDGLLIVSWPIAEVPMEFCGFTHIERRTYGDAQLIFYRRTV